jgi:hypothetical protein
MARVTLICTQHIENGNCNSSELLKIVKSIRPDVIFEELSLFNFERAYHLGTLVTLETSAIKNYLIDNDTVHLAVDTYPRTREYDETIDSLYSALTRGIYQEAFQYRNLINRHWDVIGNHGFDFLNSSANDDYFDKLESAKLVMLNILKEERMRKAHLSEVEMIKQRENEILKNVYRFAKENSFNEAIMFIGSGHRRTILPLIQEFENQQTVDLHWRFYPC